MRSAGTDTQLLILTANDYTVLGSEDFGSPGLQAIEIIGPYVEVQALGPLITVHDSTIEPHHGIGHHPHRYNERIFYITAGELDHDDALNGIRGHMATGDIGLFTEGRRGMLHSEWNNGDSEMRAFMIVYATEPIPDDVGFLVFPDANAPRYDEGAGVRTKEMAGPRSSLRLHGDIRLFTDSRVDGGASLELRLHDHEGGLLSVQEGSLCSNGVQLPTGTSVLAPPSAGDRVHRFEAESYARVLRIVHGPGFGLRLRSPEAL